MEVLRTVHQNCERVAASQQLDACVFAKIDVGCLLLRQVLLA